MSTGDAPPAGSPEQVTTSPTPTAGDGIQPPADAGRIPLPPMSVSAPAPVPVPEAFLGRLRFLDGALVLLLLVFAFLCGSFKATNGDIFLHLASGRQAAGGPPGVTSFVAPDARISQTWLFDLGAYLVYSLGPWGDVALVALKALAIAATAAFMLRAGSRAGQSVWLPAIFTFLAVMAMSPRLLLQPGVASMALLALTLAILARASRDSRSVWALPLVCALWVNLDTWFLLGPVTILLFLLGELIQSRQGGTADGPPVARLALVLLVSLVACLANPNHVFAFTTLPVGLVQTGAFTAFKSDPIYTSYFISPFEGRYFNKYFGLSAAGLSYFVLLAAGLLSFGLVAGGKFDELRWWRVLIWVAGAALSAWIYRAIPFFAIVAGPITALNFLDLAAQPAGQAFVRPASRRWAVSGRLFTAFVGGLAVLLSLPGWLHALPHYRRQVGWGFELDQGLRDACLKAKSWQDREGGTSGRRWYNTSPEAAYYLAWFCPGESTYVDGRLDLYRPVAQEFTSVRQSLTGEAVTADEEGGRAEPAWRKVFAERGIGFILFHNQDLSRSPTGLATLLRMYSNPDEFVPCFTEGSAAICAWKAPGSPGLADPGLAADFDLVAFGPSPVMAPAEPAPPATRDWWTLLLQGEGPVPTGSLSAVQHKTRFDALTLRYSVQNNQAWLASLVVSLLGTGAADSGPLGAGVLLPLRMQAGFLATGQVTGGKNPLDNAGLELMQRYLQGLDQGPPASLYLAVRTGRQGLHDSPDDPIAQRNLAESYSRLAFRTREHSRVFGLLPHAQMVRQGQIAAALNSVLKGSARLEQQRAAHEMLFDTHREPAYFELRVKHLREYLRLAKQVGPSVPVPRDKLPDYFKNLETTLKELTSQLKQRRDQYEVQSANKPLLDKARIAMENGLGETALNLLLRADPKELRDRNNPREAPGATYILSLLLAMGRVDEAREALAVDQASADARGFGAHPLGMPAYEWFLVQLGAAIGDYHMADKALENCLAAVSKQQPYASVLADLDLVPAAFAAKPIDGGTMAGIMVGSALLREAQQAAGLPWQIVRHLPLRLHPPHGPKPPGSMVAMRGAQLLWQVKDQEASLWAVRAWLALEAGRVSEARDYARRVISMSEWNTEKGVRVSVAFRARPLADLVLDLAEMRSPRH